ncbi:MAG: hypothetical protein HYZ27_05075 [Deltaproteobacteria bacterium]|nr:hypothetical protein [Deltaproteobacteria bacterium]
MTHSLRQGLGVAALVGCACPQNDSPVAHLRQMSGEVTVRQSAQSEPAPARATQALGEGHVVATGADGKAVVEFSGGNQVELEPSTVLVIRRSGGTAAQVGAVLMSGSARASSRGQGVLLAIGTPFGLTEVGAGASSVEVSLARGITVLVGEVVVLTPSGQRTTVTAGNAFTIEGLVVQVGEARPDGVVLPPMEFVLLANPQQVQIKRAGEDTWRAPKKRDSIATGDAVRTRRASNTRLQFGELASLSLQPQTEVTFGQAGVSGNSHRARYQVSVGNVVVHLRRDDKIGSLHEIEVAGLTMSVEPGLQEAAAEVSAGENGRAQVTVRFGKVRLSDGTVIEAGQAVTVEKGKVLSGARPLAETQLGLMAKSSAIVYYVNEVPPVQFLWPAEEGAGAYLFELAQDRDFAKPVFREEVKGNAFVVDKLRAGRYHWRVKGKGDWFRGTIAVEKGRDMECANCKRKNVIDDTGEQTVVYYQKVVPGITLRWKEVEGAQQYRARVYADGEFDTPLAEKSATATTVAFEEGRFEEGKYYWDVTAFAADSRELSRGRMNTLSIAYDNALVDLDIKAPRDGQKITSGSVLTRGEVQLGAKLSINGKKASVDRKGRFRESVPLAKGANQLVYRTLSADGVERYYVRLVHRR